MEIQRAELWTSETKRIFSEEDILAEIERRCREGFNDHVQIIQHSEKEQAEDAIDLIF